MDAEGLCEARLAEWSSDEELPLIGDSESAVQPLADLHTRASVAATVGDDLQQVRPEGNRVVLRHCAEVLEAEDGVGVKRLRPGTIGGVPLGSGAGAALILSREKGVKSPTGLVLLKQLTPDG